MLLALSTSRERTLRGRLRLRCFACQRRSVDCRCLPGSFRCHGVLLAGGKLGPVTVFTRIGGRTAVSRCMVVSDGRSVGVSAARAGPRCVRFCPGLRERPPGILWCSFGAFKLAPSVLVFLLRRRRPAVLGVSLPVPRRPRSCCAPIRRPPILLIHHLPQNLPAQIHDLRRALSPRSPLRPPIVSILLSNPRKPMLASGKSAMPEPTAEPVAPKKPRSEARAEAELRERVAVEVEVAHGGL